ncbi:MAG: DUF485 domain-containing protein [Neisseriaceae bacterium]|nr:DUF485 domain-containing protein [Neisseriaceae bacterium]
MDPQDVVKKVLANPDFQEMAKQKSRLGWSFSIIMFVFYVIFILYIGISPDTFAQPVSAGATTTVGIYAGLFIIVFAISITGIYVRSANGKYEDATRKVVEEVMKP